MSTSNGFDFAVDATYENEKGPFTVVSIKHDEMVIRWATGEEIRTSVAFQGRIQTRRQREQELREEKAAAAQRVAEKAKTAKSKAKTPPAP
jgi:hypothetical protein